MTEQNPTIKQLVDTLNLEPHVEGGYFKQTFKADGQPSVNTPKGSRVTMTSIYYLLSADSPIGHFHRNTSDIMHYFHAGDPITYYLIHPDGTLETKVLGPDVLAGHEYQFVVKGGVWKASTISQEGKNGYGLIGEAVAPGFEYTDMELANRQALMEAFPQHQELIQGLTREH
ncbi:MAG: cupin domain-containing protein [Aliiglaciecola sp.]|uniref:cupin domain-containing protein n=1 Tax=Aliiglaciecola sp. TaxID=1872441 RepID=UPI0032999689